MDNENDRTKLIVQCFSDIKRDKANCNNAKLRRKKEGTTPIVRLIDKQKLITPVLNNR